MEYFIYFLITLVLSILFSMAGAGAGVAVIPILHMIGVDFNLAKAVGLFGGFITTFTSTMLNLKRKVLDVKFAFPLALALLIFAPLGAQLSRFVDESLVKALFAFFLIFSASMMLFFKREPKAHFQEAWILGVLGIFVGTVAGLLGVGGGNMLLPLLVLLGFEPKKVAVAVSFVVPFSAFSSFLSYASFVKMDYLMLFSVAFGALIGAYIGNHILHVKLTQKQIKKVIAVILCMLAVKLIFSLI